jgi:HEAT repeat protein
MGRLTPADVERALADGDVAVRRRACELAPALPRRARGLARLVTGALKDALGDDPAVAEVAAWALGELGARSAVAALEAMVTDHPDPLCREAAVAALGAIGAPDGLPAVLAATHDKPAIRRRAVVALAAFDDPEAERALERALADRDWQVRAAAEDLLGRPPGSGR